ncbi:pyruvate kinase [Pseudomonas hunanensis]|nr:pyruvate kinase [Pseudomonas hunanensis]
MTIRRTKIVATLGPASNSPEVIEQLILAGLDVARLNFSHGTPDEHKARARLIRDIAAKNGRHVALLGDLQGPKIRIAKFANKRIELKVGDKFTFSTAHPLTEGNQDIVGIDYPDLVKDCGVGDELLLDDGRVVMRVETATADALHCVVIIGGPLSDHKGINRKGGGLTAPALTEKDKADIKLAAEMDLDYLAVSFPRDASDMEYARKLRDEAGGSAWLVAKIERAEAVADDETLDQLILASDAVMVARGDLGVEIGDAELIAIQKKIIQHARRNNKAVIVATQMMESMIQNPMPTRAEVSDVANAVLDNTDAVMLSAESAARQLPDRSRTGHGPYLLGRREAPDQPEVQPPPAHHLRALRRVHRPGGDVHRQPLPRRQGDHRPHRKWLHPADHVAPAFARADLRPVAAPCYPGPCQHVPRRLPDCLRPGLAAGRQGQPGGGRRAAQARPRRARRLGHPDQG